MSDKKDDTNSKSLKSLDNSDIITKRSMGRRAFLGIMAAGSAGAVLAPTQVAAADVDNGSWTDSGSCPRGYGGVYTNLTDYDDGAVTDSAGYGRGAPYC